MDDIKQEVTSHSNLKTLALAEFIVQRGLSSPAIFFFELHKPMCGIVCALNTIAAPFMQPILGAAWSGTLSYLFESREHLEEFILLIEKLEKEKQASTKAAAQQN